MSEVGNTGYADVRPANYRQALATLLPALLLAYAVLGSPLIYAHGVVPADLATGLTPTTTVDFALNKIFFPCAFALSVALFLAERPAWSTDTRLAMVALGMLLAYCAASALWAIVPGRSISQLMLVVILLATVAFSAQVSGSLDGMFRALYLVFAVTLAVNLADVLLTPPGPIGHQGIYSHKNTLGAVAALGFLMGFYGLGQRGLLRFVGLAMLPVGLYILWKSESKTSFGLALLVPMLAAGFWFMMHYLRISLTVGFVLAGIAVALLVPLLNSQGFTLGTVSLLISGNATFTGRTAIWSFAAREIAEQPLLGHGFRSFWGIGSLSPQLHAPPGFVQVTPHGHNGYVDLLLELGAIGLGLFALLYLAAISRIHRMAQQLPSVGFTAFCLIVYLGLQNLLESNWFEPLDAGTAILALLLFAPIATGREGER